MVVFKETSGYEPIGSIRGKHRKFDNLVESCLELKVDSDQYKEFSFDAEKPENASAALYSYVAEHKDIDWRFACRKRDDKTLRVYKVSKN